MSDAVTAALAPDGSGYLVPEAMNVAITVAPRVTSVLNMIGGRWGLEQWMKKQVAEAAVEWAEDGRFAALLSQSREALSDSLAQAPDEQRDQAGGTGTLVHEAIEAWSAGTPLPVLVGPAKETVDRVTPLLEAIEYEPIHVEAVVYGGLDDEDTAYAGRLDSIAKITLPGGERVTALVDLKTSKSLKASFAYQLAAYRYSDWLVTSDGDLIPTPEVNATYIVHARPEKVRLVPIDANPAAFAAFQAARFLLAARGRRFILRAVPGI